LSRRQAGGERKREFAGNPFFAKKWFPDPPQKTPNL
jgi:hypothetical protein